MKMKMTKSSPPRGEATKTLDLPVGADPDYSDHFTTDSHHRVTQPPSSVGLDLMRIQRIPFFFQVLRLDFDHFSGDSSGLSPFSRTFFFWFLPGFELAAF